MLEPQQARPAEPVQLGCALRFTLRVADRLHLRQALLFFVHAHGDELDHLLGDAEAALDLVISEPRQQ